MKPRALVCYAAGLQPKNTGHVIVGPSEDFTASAFETFGEIDGLVVEKLTSGGRDVITEPTPLSDLSDKKTSFECSSKENIEAYFRNDAAENRAGGLRILGSVQ